MVHMRRLSYLDDLHQLEPEKQFLPASIDESVQIDISRIEKRFYK